MFGLVRNILASAFILLLAQGVNAQLSLDSVKEYRTAALRQIGWDTSGNAFLSTKEIDQMVHIAINQLPNFVWGEEKVKAFAVTAASGDAYAFGDSVSQIKFAVKIDGDTVRSLKQRPPPAWNDDYAKGEDQPGKFRPTYYSLFADTLYLYPAPKGSGTDSIRVGYYSTPYASSADSVGLVVLDRRFQLGVVYHVAYQILVSTDPIGDWKGAWERYMAWATTAKANSVNRPVDPLRDEKP